jgi:hypothetical protein
MLHRHTYDVILSTRIHHFFVSHVRYITTRVAKVNRMRRRKKLWIWGRSKCTKFSKWEGWGLYHSRFLFHEQYQNEFLRNKTHILVSLLGTLGEIWTRETYSELLRVCQKKKTENSAKVYPTKRGVFLLLNFVMNCKREEKWKSSKKKKKFPAKKKLCDLIFIGASQKLNFLKTNFIFLCRLWLRETW